MKYNRTPITGYLMALLFAGMAISCSQDQVLEPQQTTPDAADLQIKAIDEGNYHGEIVPLELARQVAENETFQKLYLAGNSNPSAKNARAGNLKRTIRQAVTFKDKHNQPALHVMTYNQGGFAILSAENDAQAVLAMGDEDNVDVQHMPDIVKAWLGQQQAGVEQQRTSKRGARVGAGAKSSGPDWNSLLASTGLTQTARGARAMGPPPPGDPTNDPDPTPCQQNGVTFFEPLVKAKWNQSGGQVDHVYPFNAWAPNGAAIGCWPVAAGQVMHYYKYPTSFVSNMPVYHYGATLSMEWNKTWHNYAGGETVQLLTNIGYAGKIKWGASSGAESGMYDQDAVPAIKNVFGYKTCYRVSGPTEQDIVNQINGHRPVILTGTKYSGGSGGHAWVCSGYRKTTSTCSIDTYWLHMNWGWGGQWNGYFSTSYSSAITGTTYYDNDRKQQHMPDKDPNHSNNSDIYVFNRAMIVMLPQATW